MRVRVQVSLDAVLLKLCDPFLEPLSGKAWGKVDPRCGHALCCCCVLWDLWGMQRWGEGVMHCNMEGAAVLQLRHGLGQAWAGDGMRLWQDGVVCCTR